MDNPSPSPHFTPAPLEQLMDPDWARALAPVEPTIRRLGQMLRDEQSRGTHCLPAGSDVLRAFTYPLSQVKVLIVGQDPYPTPGNPMGLSFSVRKGMALPASLKNIFQELTTDLGLPFPSSGDLTPWCENGVMLLNRVLTVQAGKPGSHRGRGWEEVTDAAIAALVNRNQPLVAILWGKDAQNLAPKLPGVPLIKSVHPSPLSAYRGFFGSRPFSRANELLRSQGATEVDWRLP